MTHLDDGADLRAVMDRSMRDLDAPDRCGPAAIASGRRIRTRRRLAVGLTGVAAIAAVTAVTLPALGGSGDATPNGNYAADPTPTPEPNPEPSPAPTSAPGIPAGWWDMPSTQMLDKLEQVLPEGVTVEFADTKMDAVRGQGPTDEGSLSGTLSASTGPGAFQILLWPPDIDPADLPDPVTTTDAAGNEHTTMTAQSSPLEERIQCEAHHDTCMPIRDDAGEQIGRASTNTERGTLLYEVTLLGPDGGGLYFYVGNSSGEKPGYEDPSAGVPPLTLGQLRALAEDPVWTSYRP